MADPDVTNPYAPPEAVVDDIVDPGAPVELAGRLARFGAAIVDSIIFMLMVYLPAGLGVLVGAFQGQGRDTLPMIAGTGLGVVGLALFSTLTYVSVKRSGQSLAKRIFGIKVVRSNGDPVSVSRVFWLRNVVNSLLSAVPFLGLLYLFADILFIFSDSRQCLHDRLADTIVVDI